MHPLLLCTNQKTSPDIFKCLLRNKLTPDWEAQHWGVHNHFLFHLSPLLLLISTGAIRDSGGCIYIILELREKHWATITFLLASTVDVTQRLISIGSPQGCCSAGFGVLPCGQGSSLSSGWGPLSFWNSAAFYITSLTPATHPITSSVRILPPFRPPQSCALVLSELTLSVLQVLQLQKETSGAMCVTTGLPHIPFLLHLPCPSPSTGATPHGSQEGCFLPALQTGHRAHVPSCLVFEHLSGGFYHSLPSWGCGPRGSSIKRPFYKDLHHSLPLSLFIPHISLASSLKCSYFFFVFQGKDTELYHINTCSEHFMFFSFWSSRKLFVFCFWICLCQRLKKLFLKFNTGFWAYNLILLFFLIFLVLGQWVSTLMLSRASLVTQLVKNLPAVQEIWVQSLGWEDPLEMWRLPSPVSWRIPWTEEPGGLQSMGSQRVGQDWATFTNIQYKW